MIGYVSAKEDIVRTSTKVNHEGIYITHNEEYDPKTNKYTFQKGDEFIPLDEVIEHISKHNLPDENFNQFISKSFENTDIGIDGLKAGQIVNLGKEGNLPAELTSISIKGAESRLVFKIGEGGKEITLSGKGKTLGDLAKSSVAVGPTAAKAFKF